MANKNLSAVVGAGSSEIGDILRTKATSLPDGKVLLDCDGSVLNTGTYPLLGALFDTGIASGFVAFDYSADGSSLLDVEALEYGGFVQANGVGLLAENTSGVKIWIKDATDTTRVVNTVSSEIIGCPSISADANEMVIPYISSSAAYDLYIYYTITGADPTTNVVITATGDFSPMIPISIMNQAGTSCKVIAAESGGSTIDVWTSGSDVSTGYTETSSVAWTTAVPALVGTFGYSDDLLDIVIPHANGLTMSKDGGTTWTQNIALPDLAEPRSVAVDISSNFYATTSEFTRVFKTVDTGANFTVALDATEAGALLDTSVGVSRVDIVSVHNDASGYLYVFGNVYPTNEVAGSGVSAHWGVWYSEDEGVTWTGTLIPVHTYTGNTQEIVIFGTTGPKFPWIEKAGGNAGYVANVSATTSHLYWTMTSGKILPYIAGHKIVADAP